MNSDIKDMVEEYSGLINQWFGVSGKIDDPEVAIQNYIKNTEKSITDLKKKYNEVKRDLIDSILIQNHLLKQRNRLITIADSLNKIISDSKIKPSNLFLIGSSNIIEEANIRLKTIKKSKFVIKNIDSET